MIEQFVMTDEDQGQYEAEAFRDIAASFGRFHLAMLEHLPAHLADAILLQYSAGVLRMANDGDIQHPDSHDG